MNEALIKFLEDEIRTEEILIRHSTAVLKKVERTLKEYPRDTVSLDWKPSILKRLDFKNKRLKRLEIMLEKHKNI